MRRMKRGHYKEDEFQTTMEKVIAYIVRHRDISILVGVGVIAGIIFLGYFLSRGEQQSPEAEMLHMQAVGLVTMGRFQEAEPVLQELSTRYQNTRPGKIGLYYLGVLYYYSGRFEEALKNFDKFLTLQKDSPLLVPAALFGAGCSAEGLKDYKRALTYYEKVTKDKNSSFYYMGMLFLGRANGLLGNTEKAQEILGELIEQNPPREIADDAKFYIGYFNK